jgi:AraC-like DNA-binding protein
MLKETEQKIGDPSTNKQTFTDVDLKILCCRYWLLSVWDCHDLAFPFWRIYWNKNSGGQLIFNQVVYEMEPNKIFIIPPFTSFCTSFSRNHHFKSGIHVRGRHLNPEDDDSELAQTYLLHLFIHFNLEVPFENVLPGIFTMDMTDSLLEKFTYLTSTLKKENTFFYVTYTLKLQALIKVILSNIGPQLFSTLRVDYRILKSIRYIERNITEKLTNSKIAGEANMATNSFSRLFKEKMNITLHNFIVKRKISRACKLLLNSDMTIQEISDSLSFSDRHHFSRVFKKLIGITPFLYKSGKFS